MIVSLLTSAGTGLGSLSITVEPVDAQVEITGPNGYTRTQVGGGTLAGLAPGTYTVRATANGSSAAASANVQAGGTAYITLTPGVEDFRYHLNDSRSPGEEVTFWVDQGGAEVPGSRISRVTTPGYTQAFGNFRLRLGVAATLYAQSARLGTQAAPFTPRSRPGSNVVTVYLYQGSISAG